MGLIASLAGIDWNPQGAMATLDDKILGEKLHYYCSSSSEDEEEGKQPSERTLDKEDVDKSSQQQAAKNKPKFIPESDIRQWEGSSANVRRFYLSLIYSRLCHDACND